VQAEAFPERNVRHWVCEKEARRASRRAQKSSANLETL
jgi:hypothetical protein